MLRPQPSQPIAPLPSRWISANAGAGKTRALVNHVLQLLLMGVTPERICCITYTKAAAGEMRERILDVLRDLLVLPDAACRELIRERTGQEYSVNHARRLFAQVLDSPYGGLQLTTIHGFCQQLLRQFPLEAGLSPQFTVLEESESDALQFLARQRMLRQAGGEVADALALLAERSGEYGVNEMLAQATAQAGWWRNLQQRYPLPAQLKAALFSYHGIAPETTDAALREAACQSLLPEADCIALRGVLDQFQAATDRALAQHLTPWLDGSRERASLLDALVGHFFTQAGEIKKSPFTKKAPEQDLLARLAARCVAFAQQCRTLACAEESYAASLVVHAYLNAYDQLKMERQALDYDDLITRTEQLLRDCGGWVMTKLDHRIDHLLIDEAQDTSPGQWRLARMLVEELMANGEGIGSGGVPRTLLVVGDEKQSIYSFQGADPRQFAQEEYFFFNVLSQAGQSVARSSLEHSYRSAEPVLQVVDAVAALPEIATALSAAGTPAPHRLVHTTLGGRVVLHAPLAAPEKPAPLPYRLPMEYAITETAAQQLANHIAADIVAWIEQGRCQPGDILILLRTRKPMADCLIRALERAGIPIAGIDRLRLSEHLAVRDMLALMHWCADTGDDLALAQVLRSPLVGIDETMLETLCFNRPASLWQQVAAQQPALATQLRAMLAKRHQLPYDFLTSILDVQGARRQFATRFGEEVHEVLDELKAQAAAMPARKGANLTQFADWMTRSQREIKRQPEARGDTVRIMTVHGAKGLEAPIVIMADAVGVPTTGRERGFHTDDDSLPLQAFSTEATFAPAYLAAKERCRQALLNEYYRLLYVAMTRPRRELHLYASENPKRTLSSASWYSMVARAMTPLAVTDADGNLVVEKKGEAVRQSTSACTTIAPLPTWAHEPVPALPATSPVMSPSCLAVLETFAAATGSGGANIRGERIHRVLQFLTATSSADDIAALVQWTAPDWTAEAQQKVATEIARLHEQERWLWALPGMAEASIGGTIDGQRYSGQIDRLIVTPEEVLIVDYKTGNHVPSSPQNVPEAYRLQLKVYSLLLAQLYPNHCVRAALCWTAAPSLMWLDALLETTTLPVNSE